MKRIRPSILLATLAAMTATAGAEPPAVLRADNVYAKGTAECPDAVVAANGDIVVTFANHGDVQPGCESLFIRSSDGGKTWSDVYLRMGADDPAERGIMVQGLLRRKDGKILASRTEVHCPGGVLGAHRTTKMEVLLSSDDGKTFDVIGKMPFKAETMAGPYGPMLQLADGSIIQPGYTEGLSAGYWQSRDDGKTFGPFRPVFLDPPENVKEALHFNETAYVVRDDGSLFAIARNDKNYLFYAIESKDHGKTWSKPRATPLTGGSPALRKLADGSLLLAQRDKSRPALGIYRSTDGGSSWQYLYRLPKPAGVPDLPDGHWARPTMEQTWMPGEGLVGYPAWVDLPNGQIYAVWHVHNKNSPPAAPGRDTYGIVGNLIGPAKSPAVAAENRANVYTAAQTGAILKAQVISGPGALASLVDPSAGLGLTVTPQRIEDRTSAEAEVHAAEDDLFYVLDGAATFHLGGTLGETWTYAHGNQAGRSQRGASEFVVGPGDLIVVPRGTAHRITCPGGFVEVLMIKRTDALGGGAGATTRPSTRKGM